MHQPVARVVGLEGHGHLGAVGRHMDGIAPGAREAPTVDYRINRADWNLLEHEALYEKALVLPGGEFSFVLTVTQPGSWMFMCMLPYHMEMGMMGEMATKGMFMMNMQM